MDVFKTKVGDYRAIPISLENLDKYTQREYPYFQTINDKPIYFALCPICDNPIRIVGLFKKEGRSFVGSPQPYGRHFEHGVKGLAFFDRDAYLACPYHATNAHGSSRKKRARDNKTGQAIYKLMKENFDRIIYIWNKTTEIKISTAFAEELLTLWKANQGWRYYDNTFNNLSYMLLYPLPSINLTGRLISKESKLYKVLSKQKELFLKSTNNQNYVQIKTKKGFSTALHFYLSSHKYKVNKESLIESFTLVVTLNKKTIYKYLIEVDQYYLYNLINKSPNETYRDKALLKIAEKIL